ncbi:MAG: homocysteine S-methyltransferase family protein [Lachnospiraceae bacterium]|nr:homocysteine S-methyltransferase family protein [Lachnospiraceae bacterium]
MAEGQKNGLLQRLNRDFLLFDGGMGTQLQNAGLKAGQIPEELNIERPELIRTVHSNYLKAGADFITTNTFGCNRLKMAGAKYSVPEMIKAAIDNAKAAQEACGRVNDSYIALDIGPIGTMLKPLGTLPFEEAYELIAEQIDAAGDGVDAILFETMTDVYEVKAAILAAKEHSDLPVFTTMTFDKTGRTLTGTNVETFVNIVESLGVTMLGVNCSLGPKELAPIIEDLLKFSHVPVMAQPNAGLPNFKHGETVYELTPEQFIADLKGYMEDGLAVCGGCCGTTPDFIRALNENRPAQVNARQNPYLPKVSSPTRTVTFDGHVIVCGERLNPTGKKKMQAALKENHLDEVIAEGIRQEDAGAEVLDVNVGLPGINEAEMMVKIIPMLQEVINLPLQIDSSSAEALEAACRIYNGRPLINSVNAKPAVLDAVLPIVKKYGGIVIGLTLEEEIPLLAEERVELAKRIIDRAGQEGIRPQDVIIDCLTLTASAQQKEVAETLKAVRTVREMGHHCVLGVSNVSFGLPYRALLNRTFLTMAIDAGLDLPIMNPLDAQMMACVDAANLLLNYDKDSTCYINKYANASDGAGISTNAVNSGSGNGAAAGTPNGSDTGAGNAAAFDLSYMIKKGMKNEVTEQTKAELAQKDAMTLINDVIIPALNQVGKDYESGKIFLPQLIQAAETTKLAFQVVQETFSASDEKKGPVIICTVEGDIHDIGKNIVKVVLESYGYDMIDLGKDVKAEEVVEACRKYAPKAIGLSALMTTTVVNMQQTIDALHAADITIPVWVGGAVLTQAIADEIGADYYAEDAMGTVRLMDQIIH